VRRVFWGIRHSTLEKGKSKRSTIFIAHICAIFSRWVPEKIICCAHEALAVHLAIGYSASKMLVIPNGYDLSRFRPDLGEREAVRNEFGFSQDDFVLGKVARFDPLKDHFNLLEALAVVAQQQINFKCLLVGKGLFSDNISLGGRIAEMGLQNKI